MRIVTRDPRKRRKNEIICGHKTCITMMMIEKGVLPFVVDTKVGKNSLLSFLRSTRVYGKSLTIGTLDTSVNMDLSNAFSGCTKSMKSIRDSSRYHPINNKGKYQSGGSATIELMEEMSGYLKGFKRPKLKDGLQSCRVNHDSMVTAERRRKELRVQATVSGVYNLTRRHDGHEKNIMLRFIQSESLMVPLSASDVLEKTFGNAGIGLEFYGAFYKEDGKLGQKDIHWKWCVVLGPMNDKYIFGLGETPEDAEEEAKRGIANLMIQQSNKEKR